MVILGLIGFGVGRIELQKFIRERLSGVNATKKAHVIEMYEAIESKVISLSTSDLVKKNTRALTADTSRTSAAYTAAAAAVEDELLLTRQVRDFDDIKILSPKGIIQYVNNPKYDAELGTTGDATIKAAFQRGSAGINFSEPMSDLGEENGVEEMLVSAPIKDSSGSFLGVIVVEAEISNIIEEVLDATGLSRTGETVLVYNDNHSALVISPLKFEPKAALTKRITYGDAKGVALQRAAKGESGAGTTIDYRGVKVMADWDTIPELGWGIETKIDYAEAMSSLDRVLLYGRWGSLISLILLFVLSEYLVGFFVTSRVKQLRYAAQEMADGKSVTIPPHLMQEHDELGELATALHNLSQKEKHGTSATADIPSEAPKHHH
jgi:HAMP domain-containing protein/predicted nucleic acid-binding protein